MYHVVLSLMGKQQKINLWGIPSSKYRNEPTSLMASNWQQIHRCGDPPVHRLSHQATTSHAASSDQCSDAWMQAFRNMVNKVDRVWLHVGQYRYQKICSRTQHILYTLHQTIACKTPIRYMLHYTHMNNIAECLKTKAHVSWLRPRYGNIFHNVTHKCRTSARLGDAHNSSHNT